MIETTLKKSKNIVSLGSKYCKKILYTFKGGSAFILNGVCNSKNAFTLVGANLKKKSPAFSGGFGKAIRMSQKMVSLGQCGNSCNWIFVLKIKILI